MWTKSHWGSLIHPTSVHPEFGKDLASCLTALRAAIDDILRRHPNAIFHIIFTGHSKGGGMATIVAPADCHKFRVYFIYLVTLGASRAFADAYSAAWATAILRLENTLAIYIKEDIVPQLPPWSYQTIRIPAKDRTKKSMQEHTKTE